MRFFKSNRRWVALLTAFVFIWLLQVSGLPLRAERVAPATGVAADDQQPGAIEQSAPAGQVGKKKSPLIPIIFGLVVVGAVAAVLILVVFKTKYDIVGSWTFIVSGTWSDTWTPVVFVGDEKSGNYQIADWWDGAGSYTVDGKKLSMKSVIYPSWTSNIEFTDKDSLSGTIDVTDYGFHWNVTATRIGATAQIPKKPEGSGGMLDHLIK